MRNTREYLMTLLDTLQLHCQAVDDLLRLASDHAERARHMMEACHMNLSMVQHTMAMMRQQLAQANLEPIGPDALLTEREAATLLALSVAQLRLLRRTEGLPTITVEGKTRVRADDLQDWLKTRGGRDPESREDTP